MCFAGTAKLIVSLLQETQENDQRVTMLQLVDKLKVKHKAVGLFCSICIGSSVKLMLQDRNARHMDLVIHGLLEVKI